MKTPPFRFLLILITLPVVSASAQLISYTDGSQVNLLNAYNAVLEVSGTNAGGNETADQARFMNDLGASANLQRYSNTNPAATLDFGAVRTVKTISTTMQDYYNFGFTAATVETSNDGVNWTTYTGGMTVDSGTSNGNNVVTLDTPVSGRYVRLTPTAFVNGGGAGTDQRWVFGTMRAFGDTGALAGDPNLTIVANGGFSQAQTISYIGSVNDVNGSALMTPGADPHVTRTVLYNIGDGEGFQLDLGQTFSVDKATLAVDFLTATLDNPIVLTISGSTDGTNFSTLGTYTWTSDVSFEDVNFSFAAGNARYLNAIFSSNLDSDMRVSDFAFFQAVPEPSTVALAAIGVSAVLFRLRRKQRLS